MKNFLTKFLHQTMAAEPLANDIKKGGYFFCTEP